MRRSIHRRLSLCILPCFAILWAAGGVAVYVSVQRSLVKTLDTELESLARPIRMSTVLEFSRGPGRRIRGPGRRPFESLAGVGDKDSSTYYQLWDTNGETLRKSPSLGDLSLPPPFEVEDSPRYLDQPLENGDHVRMIMAGPGGRPLRRGPGADSSQVTLTIAKSQRPIEATMRRWLVGLLTSSAIVIGLAGALLRLSLKSGLRPLDRLASNASKIDASSLATRFDLGGMPNELQPIAETLNDLLARLERSFERERRVSADLAHELRTPVASLKSLGEVALKWPEQATAENYEDVCEISNRMAEIIESMLLLARLEEGSVQPTSAPVDIKQIVQRHCEDLSKSAAESELDFDLNLDEIPIINSDPDLLGIVVSNLLRNAANHAPAKSQIKVTGGHNGTILSVSNPAPDLELGDLSHLFERFWKSDISRSSSNTGLGLSIALSAASVIGLNLTAQLDKDQQVTFQVSMRRCEERS